MKKTLKITLCMLMAAAGLTISNADIALAQQAQAQATLEEAPGDGSGSGDTCPISNCSRSSTDEYCVSGSTRCWPMKWVD